jgi:hypothetical protein
MLMPSGPCPADPLLFFSTSYAMQLWGTRLLAARLRPWRQGFLLWRAVRSMEARGAARAGISPAGLAAPTGLKNRGKGLVRTVFSN